MNLYQLAGGDEGLRKHLPGVGLVGAEATAQHKGEDLMVRRFADVFNL